ncbi:hypothetical protein [Haloechinothrix halophila]|uniref:hypothetical protein n=1 Tax=Haloechinothrix halophila TaxID=1069073 RepID=UPI0004097F7E|nr:hypothetical protein [Haloechinothrix halophila]
MSDLLAYAEVRKLAATLGIEPTELDGFDELGATRLRELRDAIKNRWFERYRGAFDKIIALAKFVPTPIAAKLAEHAFGPFLSAQAAALLPPKQVADIAVKAPPSFLAATPRHLDPPRITPILDHIPLAVLRATTREVLDRGDHIGLAQFADHVPPELIQSIVDVIDSDEHLLATGQYIESDQTLNRLIRLLTDDRVRSAVDTALGTSRESRLQGIGLLSRLDDANLARVEREILLADPAALAAVAHDVLDAGVQSALLHVATKLEPATAVHLIGSVTDEQLNELARRITEAETVAALLDLADKVDVPTMRRLAALDEFPSVRQIAERSGLGDRLDAITA